jgi:membrane protein implicated in regulation of membrane protease activity
MQSLTLLPWHWLALGLVLIVLEVMVSGYVLLWLGIPALLVGAAMLLQPGLSLAMQIGLFGVLAVISLAASLTMRRRKAAAASTVNTGAARFIGRTAILTTALQAGHGEVALGDTVWPVSGPDLPAGTEVTITGSDGIVLTVQRKE